MPSPAEYTVGTRVQGVVPAHYMRPVSISLTPAPGQIPYPYSGYTTTSPKPPTPGQYKDFMTSACQAWGIKEELQSKFAISFVDPRAEHKGERWLISSQKEWELFWSFNSHLVGQQSSTLKVFEIVVQPTLPSIFIEVTPVASTTTTTKPTATASPKHRKDATIIPGFAYPSVIPGSTTLGGGDAAAKARTVAADAIEKRDSDDARAGISFRAGQHLYDVEKKMVKELEKANKNQEQQQQSAFHPSSTPAASGSAQPPPTSFTSSFPASSSAQRQLFPQFFSPFGPADGRFPGQHPSSAQAPFGGFRSSFPGPLRPPGPAVGATSNNDQPLGQAYLDALNTIFPGATADGNGQSLLPANGAEAAHRVLNALGKLTAKPSATPAADAAPQAATGESSSSVSKPTEATPASTQAPHEQAEASSETTKPTAAATSSTPDRAALKKLQQQEQKKVFKEHEQMMKQKVRELEEQVQESRQRQAARQQEQQQEEQPAKTDFERLMERSRAQGEALNAFFGNVTQRRAERLNGGGGATAAPGNAAVKADGNDSTDTPPSEPLREAESPARNNDSSATTTAPTAASATKPATATTTTNPTIEAQNSYIEDLWQKRLRQMGHELPETHNYLSRFPQQSMKQQGQQAPAQAPASAWTLPTSSGKSTTATTGTTGTTRPVTVEDGNSSEPEEWEVLRQDTATSTSASASASTNGSNAADSPTTAAAATHNEPSAAAKEKGKARAVEIDDGGSGSAQSDGEGALNNNSDKSVEQNNQTLADAFEEMLARSRAQQ